MVGMKQFFQRDEVLAVFNSLALIVYIIFFTVVLPMIFGFGAASGFESGDIFEKFKFYYGISFAVLGIIALIGVGAFVFRKDDQKYNLLYIHNPAKSFLNFSAVRNPVTLAFISLLFFGLTIGIVGVVYQQTFFVDIPIVEEQVQESALLFFSIYPASPAENVLLVFVVLLSFLGLGLIWRKYRWNEDVLKVLAILTAGLVGLLFWVTIHTMRYGASESTLQGVATFGMFMGVMIPLFGSVIPSFILHDINNFSVKISQLFGSDLAIGIAVSVWVSLLFLFGVYWYLFFRGRKKSSKVAEDVIGK